MAPMSRITKPLVAVVVAIPPEDANRSPLRLTSKVALLGPVFDDLVDPGHVRRIDARTRNDRVMTLVGGQVHLPGGVSRRNPAVVESRGLRPQVAQIALEPINALFPLERV